MNGLLGAFGPQSAGAGRFLSGLLSAPPAQQPGISVPGNKFYPGYSFGSMSYPILQRLGVLPVGGMPPGAQMQQGYGQGLLSPPPAPAAPTPQQPAAPALTPDQMAAINMMVRRRDRMLNGR